MARECVLKYFLKAKTEYAELHLIGDDKKNLNGVLYEIGRGTSFRNAITTVLSAYVSHATRT